MSIESSLRQLDESFKKKTTLRTDFQKYLLSSASAFLAVLIAFHREVSSTLSIHLFWSISLGSLSLGILTGSISLFSSVSYAESAHRKLVESMRKQFHDGAEFFEPVFVPQKRIFVFCSVSSYVFLIASVLCFTVYAILSDYQ